MDMVELAQLVDQMRRGQKVHATAKGAFALASLERLERRVDDVVREILDQPAAIRQMTEDLADTFKMPGE
jgi:hypothetical protein